METRTGSKVQELVEALHEDMGDARTDLESARKRFRALETEARGVNGLSAFFRSQGQALDKMLDGLEEEKEDAARKLLGSDKPEIKQSVDEAKAKAVAEAKGEG